jgi:hypothetical protein
VNGAAAFVEKMAMSAGGRGQARVAIRVGLAIAGFKLFRGQSQVGGGAGGIARGQVDLAGLRTAFRASRLALKAKMETADLDKGGQEITRSTFEHDSA